MPPPDNRTAANLVTDRRCVSRPCAMQSNVTPAGAGAYRLWDRQDRSGEHVIASVEFGVAAEGEEFHGE